ncbi:MAG: carbon-nitrogen family hydrolase, partial [Phycisphaeraceae bacterium]|nr:carbon-nitrogen family hydrolase [Phycisphaeraceae bacterium]
PELYRRMVDAGAEMFLVASAWPAARREAWRLFNQARAHENLAFLFSCNGCGTSGGALLGGHSMFVDPWGKILAEAGEEPCLLTAEVDPAAVADARGRFSALDDRVFFA